MLRGMSQEQDRQRYRDAMHAVQSGVAMRIQVDPGHATPKDLRTGLNSAHVSVAALVGLLVNKGILSFDEYAEAVAAEAVAEKRRYEEFLTQHFGRPVILH
jgi:hypothetical protein